jgi:hypothetical protein
VASEVLLVLQILGGAMLLETNLALVLQVKTLIKATQVTQISLSLCDSLLVIYIYIYIDY